MPSFGEKLKQEREKRKMTLEEISVSTKIGTRMLQALEENKFNQLPGGIFNKGFVRAYSRCIGLDEDQAVADYLAASGDSPSVSAEIAAHERQMLEQEDAGEVSRIEGSSSSPNRQMLWGIFAAILLIVALALYFWSHHQRELRKQAAHVTPTAEALSSTSSSTPSAGVNGAGTNGGSPSSLSPSTVSMMQSAATQSNTGSPAHSQPATSKPLNQTGTPANPPAPTPVVGEFIVVVQAREQSWVSILADGERVPSELLEPGSERAVQAKREIIVKAGNAGAVDFLFNGKKLAVGGEFGEVKTVTFGPRGIVPNVVEPAPTP
ncbi:MAG TPA: RodZ domain-containing protein [Terriglobales bacterium]|nr:RodZ domain-containing protein [Terriglobales bacterium]